MAEYTTYSTVSWSDGTPISSDRLQQMSTNSEAIKTTTQTYAKGVLARQTNSSTTPATANETTDALPIIEFSQTGAGYGISGDSRVTVGANRLFRITLTIPAVDFVGAFDAGDSQYYFKLVEGSSESDTQVAQWYFSSPEVSTNGMKVAGGDYSVLLESSTGKTSQTYAVFMSRVAGSAAYQVFATTTSMIQLTAEDCGSY